MMERTTAGFDYLGYFIKPGLIAAAKKTVHNFLKHIVRLYEQGADMFRIGQYVKKWVQWVKAGVFERDGKGRIGFRRRLVSRVGTPGPFQTPLVTIK